ncbi:Electron transport complex protein RnfG [uncultured Candidatus Thioglobus sp.]|nr:Electron transport complex protein RnfG [uncultured Candidatus Thioglobus sp.]
MKVLSTIWLPMGALTVCCTLILVISHTLLADRIVENIKLEQLKILRTVMTADFDNDIYNDVKSINYKNTEGHITPIRIYRARKLQQPVGVVLMPLEAVGYNGKILLAMGILYDGKISKMQIFTHNETEGYGANVHQQNSDWLNIFSQYSINTVPLDSWGVVADGGVFDQLSGATITSRGVVNAIRSGLELYMTEKNTLFLD